MKEFFIIPQTDISVSNGVAKTVGDNVTNGRKNSGKRNFSSSFEETIAEGTNSGCDYNACQTKDSPSPQVPQSLLEFEDIFDFKTKPVLFQHDDHWDLLSKDGKLVYFDEEGIKEHPFEDSQIASTFGNVVHHVHNHGEECGHRRVQHGDHVDFIVGDQLHHIHDDHCHLHGNLTVTEHLDWDELLSFLNEENFK